MINRLYEINAATWVRRLSDKYRTYIDLGNVPSHEWDTIAGRGFDAVWLMGIWERSPAAIQINLEDEHFLSDMRKTLKNFSPEPDLIGSAYSIRDYKPEERLGGLRGLKLARTELKKRGLKLILDYVPNHVSPDHAWTHDHPEYFIRGDDKDIHMKPKSFLRVGNHIFARARDPQYDPWSDVLQLNIFNQNLRRATVDTLSHIARLADGVRCDMAMLMLSNIFTRTWGERAGKQPKTEFWSYVINSIRHTHEDFLFIAEAYWDMEQDLMDLGFDYAYDKLLYDNLVEDKPVALHEHLTKPVDFQKRLIRFIENHDEPRASKVFKDPELKSANLVLMTTPGIPMLHDGQLDGRKVRVPVQLGRLPLEKLSSETKVFYQGLLELNALKPTFNNWQLHKVSASRGFGRASRSVLAWSWTGDGATYLVIVNWSDSSAQAKVELPGIRFRRLYKVLNINGKNPKPKYEDHSLSLKLASRQSCLFRIESQ